MIPSVASLLKHSVADLVEFVVTAAELQQSAAVKAAKGIIALVDVTGSEANARAALKAAGVADCTVKNSMQLVWAYDSVVRPGHADEAWFDGLLYAHAVEVRRALAKVPVKKLAEAGLFKKSAKANLVEFELIGDTGLTRAERDAKSDKEIADKQAAEVKAAKAKETPAADQSVEAKAPATKAAETATPPAATTAPTPPAEKSVAKQFETVIGAAEKFLEAVVPKADDVTVETLKQRLAQLVVKMDSLATARAAATRVAASA